MALPAATAIVPPVRLMLPPVSVYPVTAKFSDLTAAMPWETVTVPAGLTKSASDPLDQSDVYGPPLDSAQSCVVALSHVVLTPEKYRVPAVAIPAQAREHTASNEAMSQRLARDWALPRPAGSRL